MKSLPEGGSASVKTDYYVIVKTAKTGYVRDRSAPPPGVGLRRVQLAKRCGLPVWLIERICSGNGFSVSSFA
jgi:hypothetical protein